MSFLPPGGAQPPQQFAVGPPQAGGETHPAFDQIRALAAQFQAQRQPDPNKLRSIMMALQAADALNTSDFLRRPGTFETDPLMKPFARPGNPLPMLGAYGLEDLLLNILAKKHPALGKDAQLSQALMNAGGILKTNASAAKMGGKP